MVTGAPDDVISWTETGDAFRISDLTRLENETLPTYFRHRRFQSLVRQLNFYNFRKVNRERNFWVYKHSLFHRDRPEELHLLRRRTCPGVDGRKARPENGSRGKESVPKSVFSPKNDVVPRSVFAVSPHESSDSDEESSVEGTRITETLPTTVTVKKRSSESPASFVPDGKETPMASDTTIVMAPYIVESKKARIETVHTEPLLDPKSTGISQLVSPTSKDSSTPLDFNQQGALVTKVSRQLEEHAKRAAVSLGKSFMKKRAGGLTPTYVSDTMRFHALTYDDEVDIYDSEQGCFLENNTKDQTFGVDDVSVDNSESGATLVSFTENEASEESSRANPILPYFDDNIIYQVVKQLQDARDYNISEITTAIAEFCLTTDPQDPLIGDKAIKLMSRHADLAQEFCCYKLALSPNFGNHEQCMIALFSGQSKETIRGFKTFVLNKLKDLLRQLKSANVGGTSTLAKCYNIWFSGVTLSA